jgi:hypothetical protein
LDLKLKRHDLHENISFGLKGFKNKNGKIKVKKKYKRKKNMKNIHNKVKRKKVY